MSYKKHCSKGCAFGGESGHNVRELRTQENVYHTLLTWETYDDQFANGTGAPPGIGERGNEALETTAGVDPQNCLPDGARHRGAATGGRWCCAQ